MLRLIWFLNLNKTMLMGLETIEFNLVIVMTSEKFGGVGVVVGFVLVIVLFFSCDRGETKSTSTLKT